MTKLLLVIDSLNAGGAQRQLVTLAKEFQSKGHEVEFFIYHPHYDHFLEIVESSSIVVHSYDKRKRFSLAAPFKLAQLINDNKYDGAIAFLRTPGLYLELAKLVQIILFRHTPTVIFSDRNSFLEDLQDRPLSMKLKVLGQFHRLSDHVVTNSQYHREKLSEHFPWMGSKLSTIYNGFDIELFQRSKPYNPVNKNNLLCVSTIALHKNYEKLVDALIYYKNMWGDPPNVKWVGKLTQNKSNLAALNKVKQSILNEGLENKIEFIGVTRDIASCYEGASALIHPSLMEGFSNAIIESMAYGLPQIIGNVCDHGWLISTCSNGLLFEPTDHVSIANAIREFIEADDSQRAQWSRNSQEAAACRFSQSKAVKQYLQLVNGTTSSIDEH